VPRRLRPVLVEAAGSMLVSAYFMLTSEVAGPRVPLPHG
jgi:hypothetical protein